MSANSNQSNSLAEIQAHLRNLYRLNNSGSVNDIRYNRAGVILNPGDIIRIEPYKQLGDYVISEVLPPQGMPAQSFNIAVRWSSDLTAMPASGSSSALPQSVTTKLDVDSGELGHWKLLVSGTGYKVEVGQPLENKIYKNRLNLRYLSWGNTMYHFMRGEYSLLPDIYTYEDKTPVKFTAYSTDLDSEDQFSVNLTALGTRYIIEKASLDGFKGSSGKLMPGTKLVLNLGNPSKAI